MENKSQRGGARKGAGRKTTGVPGKTINISFRISPAEKSIIETKAKAAGKSTSRFLIDLALNA